MQTQFVSNLKKKIAVENAIPHAAAAAIELKELIENNEDPSMAKMQKIILGSPALTAMVLRAASSAAQGAASQVTDVRRALIVLGKRPLLAISVAAMVQAVISERVKNALLDSRQFALHSTFVGIMARFLFELQVREHGLKSEYTTDEIFACGVLHEVGLGLFAVTEPKEFRNVVEKSRHHMLTLSDEFLRRYDEDPYPLTVEVLNAWNIAPKVTQLISAMSNPESHPTESKAAACLVYAEYLAETFGYGLTRNTANTECLAFVRETIGMNDDEELEAVELIGEIAWDCIPAAA